jgi:hypothetical protein
LAIPKAYDSAGAVAVLPDGVGIDRPDNSLASHLLKDVPENLVASQANLHIVQVNILQSIAPCQSVPDS